MKNYIFLFLAVAVFIYFPSFTSFYTNDDFFHLKISNASSVSDFVNFFNFTSPPSGYASYRPLTTQVFYFLGRNIFDLNPLPLHLISFAVFAAGVYLTFIIASDLANKKVGLFTSFLYTFSAIHFGHFYFLGTFQEVGMYLFGMVSIYYFLHYLKYHKKWNYVYSILTFILALLSKETAVALPIINLVVYLYLANVKKAKMIIKDIAMILLPYLLILGIYLYFHIFIYGFAGGESYESNYDAAKTLNTLFWYGIWGVGIPEMFVDFVGSNVKINPNLFKFWGNESKLILGSFIIFSLTFLAGALPQTKRNPLKLISLFLFGISWFIIALGPVLFFPFHKFAYNLTLPSFGLFFLMANVICTKNFKYITFISLLFLLLNISTISLTRKTHWTVRGSEISRKVNDYFIQNSEMYKFKKVVFYDIPEDSDLPWSPTEVAKGVLSDKNYFDVFYPNKFEVVYSSGGKQNNAENLYSRQFLGY